MRSHRVVLALAAALAMSPVRQSATAAEVYPAAYQRGGIKRHPRNWTLCAAISAQTPTVPGSVPGDAAATPETAAPKQKPKQKPKRKGPPSAVTVINATANTATGIVITAGDKTTKLSKPLAPKGRATVRLPKMKGCTVSVAATFEGGGKSDAETFDVCKEKSIRFTD